jgi:hypothetical protein
MFRAFAEDTQPNLRSAVATVTIASVDLDDPLQPTGSLFASAARQRLSSFRACRIEARGG